MLNVTINAQKLQVPEGSTLLQAARQAGVSVPTLCNLEHREAIGACRVCLVEVEGARTLLASCSTPATEGMVVRTHSARARAARRQVVELLLSEHEGDCPTCDRGGDCELRALAEEMGVTCLPYEGLKAKKRIDSSTPALVRDNA